MGNSGVSVFSSSLTIINTMIGSGMIATPYAFRCLGLIQGFLWLLISAALSWFALHLIGVLGSRTTGRCTYYQAALQIAPPMAPWIDVAVIAQSIGVGIAYLLLIGTAVPFVIEQAIPSAAGTVFSNRTFILCIIMLIVLLPLSLLRSLKALKFSSVIAVIAIIYIFSIVIVYFAMYLTYKDDISLPPLIPPREEIVLWRGDINSFLRGLPIFILGLTCHQNLFKIYHEMSRPSSRRLDIAGLIGITFAVVVYAVIACFGYITIGDTVQSQLFDSYDSPENRTHFSLILDIFDKGRVTLIGARLCLAVLVMTAFPMQSHPARDSICQLITLAQQKIKERDYRKISESEDDGNREVESLLSKNEEEGRDKEGQHDRHDNEQQLVNRGAEGIDPEVSNRSHSHSPSSSSSSQTLAASLRSSRSSLAIPLSEPPFSWRKHIFITTVFCSITLLCAIFITDLSIILAFVGATGSNAIAFIFGPAMYFMISENVWYKGKRKFMTLCMLAFSFVFMISVLVFLIVDMIRGGQ